MTNTSEVNTDDWTIKELAGIKFKVPQKYAVGTTLSGNIIDGVETGHKYLSKDLTIRINDTNWTNNKDKFMNADLATQTVSDINGTEIQTFSLNEKSTAFFELNNTTITIEWQGDEITPEIKAIISSFIQDN